MFMQIPVFFALYWNRTSPLSSTDLFFLCLCRSQFSLHYTGIEPRPWVPQTYFSYVYADPSFLCTILESNLALEFHRPIFPMFMQIPVFFALYWNRTSPLSSTDLFFLCLCRSQFSLHYTGIEPRPWVPQTYFSYVYADPSFLCTILESNLALEFHRPIFPMFMQIPVFFALYWNRTSPLSSTDLFFHCPVLYLV